MKKDYVDRVYTMRAGLYGVTHPLIFGGWDASWRQFAAWLAPPAGGAPAVDLCTGQGHAAIEYLSVWKHMGISNIDIIGVDMNEKMISIGEKRIVQRGLENEITLVRGDVMDMCPGSPPRGFSTFEDETFGSALCVFGIGGVEEPAAAAVEMLRIVKTGGRIAVIESILPVAGLHPGYDHTSFPARLRETAMRRIWGWENCPDINEKLASTEYTDEEGRRFGVKTIVNAIIPVPRRILKKAITVYAGEKTGITT